VFNSSGIELTPDIGNFGSQDYESILMYAVAYTGNPTDEDALYLLIWNSYIQLLILKQWNLWKV
jgi:hypothetical protein